MNGNFRHPKFVKRYEYNYYDLATPLNAIVANGERQRKENYRFEVDNTSEANPIDWYNAYLEVNFQLTTLADSTTGVAAGIDATTKFCTTTNGQTFIKEIQVECNGITVYNNTRANETANVLSMLKYTKDYADTVGIDQLFFVDSSTGTPEARPAQPLYNEGFRKRKKLTDATAENNISIPLNLYSYFAAFKNNLHPNLKTTILLQREDDDNIILRFIAQANSTVDSKVIITKLRLWVPKIIFNEDGLKLYLSDYLKPKTWIYLKEHQEIKQSNATNDAFRITSGIRRPRHVFVWAVPTASYNNQGKNIFTFGLNKVGTDQSFARAQLEINNSIYYPQLEFSDIEESRLYRALMAFSSAYNDFLSGPIIDRINFRNLFGLLYFDLRNQSEDIKDSVVALTFRYQLTDNPAAPYTLNALVLHEKEIELYTASGKLLIKA